MFGVLYAAPDCAPDTLEAVAREFSPRIERYGPREIALDLCGVSRLFGDAHEIASELRRTAADRGIRVRIAIAVTRTVARLLVRDRAGVTVIEAGTEAAALAPLPIAMLETLAHPESQSAHHTSAIPNPKSQPRSSNHQPRSSQPPSSQPPSSPPTDTLRQWGLRTLGEFAALPPDDVAARLGQQGVWWQRIAAGDDPVPVVPSAPEERFEQALDLEWPIDGLEPLSFVLGRLMEPLEQHLERRDRGAAVLHVRLHLVKGPDGERPVHERTLQLPTPIRDARTLRTLALLDLESNPPSAAVDRVIVAVDPTPGRIVQFSLLTRPLPSPEQISTLMARLAALMGEGRCGAPATVDSWQPGAFAMQPFAPREATDSRVSGPRRREDTDANRSLGLHASTGNRVSRSSETDCFPVSVPSSPVNANGAAVPVAALRRFRFPIPARVRMEDGRPVRVTTDRRGLRGGRVEQCAGPWRTSGAWWQEADTWDRDEWDVTLNDGATYRMFRERSVDRWFLEGIVD